MRRIDYITILVTFFASPTVKGSICLDIWMKLKRFKALPIILQARNIVLIESFDKASSNYSVLYGIGVNLK